LNAKLPDPPRRPRGDGVESPRTGPSAPVDGVQGDRLPSSAAAGGTPAGGAGAPAPVPPAGPKQPGARVGREEPSRAPGTSPAAEPEALSGEEGRKRWQAALSAKAKGQRQQRARPWTKRDPYRKAVPGGRKPPPGGGAA
jgi:hypothetical protein